MLLKISTMVEDGVAIPGARASAAISVVKFEQGISWKFENQT